MQFTIQRRVRMGVWNSERLEEREKRIKLKENVGKSVTGLYRIRFLCYGFIFDFVSTFSYFFCVLFFIFLHFQSAANSQRGWISV